MTGWRVKTARGTLDLRQFAGTICYFAGALRPHWLKLSGAFIATLFTIALSLAAPWPVQVVLDHVILGREPKPWLQHAVRSVERIGNPDTAPQNEGPAQQPPAKSARLTRHSAHRNALTVGTPLDSGRRWLLMVACVAVVLIAILLGCSDYISDILQANTAQQIGSALRRRLFKHLQTLSLGFHERSRTGDLLLRLTGDISMVRDMLVDSLFELAQAILMTVGFLVVMFRLAPSMTWIAVATIPAVVLVSMLMSIQIRSAVRKAREKEGDLISVAGEVLAGISLVQAFTREDEEKERFSRLGRSSLRAGLKMARLEGRLARTVQIVTAMGTCGILYLGVGEVSAGRLTAGTLVVFMSYFNNVLKPIRQVSKIAGRMAKASSCAERIREVLDTQPEICDLPTGTPIGPIKGRLTVSHVDFSYRKGCPTLRDVSLDILPGQRVALVGPTGAGKSTIVKLLLRFYDPDQGEIRVDGRDIRHCTIESVRRQISVVQQETILFGTTIAENIAMGRIGATLADVRAAAAALDIDDWLMSLPNGYNTRVGERGVTLSGGQRQLIALARAMVRDGRILIFDEPTTGLDGMTEARIRQALRRAMQDRTTIIISHRARPLADVDRIAVVQAGRIVQVGSPDQLSREQGLFREIFGASLLDPARAGEHT